MRAGMLCAVKIRRASGRSGAGRRVSASATFEAFAAAVDTARTTSETANRSLVGLYFDAASKRLARIALVTPLPR